MLSSFFSELLHIAAETGLIEDPILPKLNEVQDLRVKLEKIKLRMGFAEESQEAKTNCTICEEMVRIRGPSTMDNTTVQFNILRPRTLMVDFLLESIRHAIIKQKLNLLL